MGISQTYNKKTIFYKKSLNKFVVKRVGFGKTILDVGCSQGRLGRHLRRHKKAVVYGLDISDRAIKEAKKNLDKAYRLNIETDDLPFPPKSFDIIICADILEHLVDPLFVLEKLKLYLKNDGIFILSIPNVANIEVRWNLLWGRFDYKREGIMDDSHLRFFTKKTICRLIRKAGLEIVGVDYSPGFSFFFFQGRVVRLKVLKKLHYALTKLSPTLFSGQFIVVAKR